MVVGVMGVGPVVVMKVPASPPLVNTTVPPSRPGPVAPVPALSVKPRATPRGARSWPAVTLPVVSVIKGAKPGLKALFRITSRAAHIAILPSVVLISASGLARLLVRFRSRPALNNTLPLVVVMAAFTLISLPQQTTKLPLVAVTAALMFTSPPAFKTKLP